jgi:DNA recombination protein RmuC
MAGVTGLWLWARGEIGKHESRSRGAEETHRAQEETYQAQLAAANEKLALVSKTQGQWDEQLKALTGEAISKSSSSLLELTEAKLKPIKETLDRFDAQARALEEKRSRAVGGIDELLRMVSDGQTRLQKETGGLVAALRAPHVRGRWGEVQLRRVIELAGMVAHCDFTEQASERDSDGRLLRPDLVVRLPGGKSIVIDSKFSIAAFLDAASTEDETERQTHLARHAKLVREHMASLGQKSYWKLFEPSPEFVVMFLGDESWFRAALDQDPTLLDAGGGECRVIPASPTTLIALLRTVAYGWQQETVAENAREVGKLGRELHERLGTFTNHFASVGKSLDAAIRNYNGAVASFDSRVLVTARKFPELGTGGDELPEISPVVTTARPVLAAAVEEKLAAAPAPVPAPLPVARPPEPANLTLEARALKDGELDGGELRAGELGAGEPQLEDEPLSLEPDRLPFEAGELPLEFAPRAADAA